MVGFLITAGAVGTMDYDPHADLGIQALVAFVGLAIMWWGADALEQQRNQYD
jgi:hypothetical protein